MTDERRGFGRLIEAGKGVKRLFDFLAEADVRAEGVAEAERLEAAARRDADTPREPRPHYHPVEESPPAEPPTAPSRPRCTVEQHAGWRCTVRGPHERCLVERIP